jgi:hypothetical protein
LLEKASGAHYVPTGHLLAIRDQALVAAPFDLSRRETTGATVAVLGPAAELGMDPSFFTSTTGVLVMVPRMPGETRRTLAWIDGQGHATPIEGPPQPFAWAAISGDGERVAYGSWDPDQIESKDFWVLDLKRRTTSRLSSPGFVFHVAWNPDGLRLAYGREIPGSGSEIWERRADGTDEPLLLYSVQEPRVGLSALAWSPAGNVLASARIAYSSAENQFDLWMLKRAADGAEHVATRYLSTTCRVPDVAFSPDGRWICFGANVLGRQQLHVQRFTGPGAGAEDARAGRWQISKQGGSSLWWSADGKEIRYLDDDQSVVSVKVETEPGFSVSDPVVVCKLESLDVWGAVSWTTDGRQLAVLQGEGAGTRHVEVVLGFFEELRARVPGAGR